ncbi:hypothetical protein PQ472_12140 [Lacticaseibacillus pabuli]|uniref:Uncharacterized protein n=1 Tax=Lacticaseibacillus pabuli TaxID=3025672 RepID=A0ABY7WTZ1_9LACO|nr:hypothetical protein [Lacticaseibacillus sp. KACC 23028]WDF82625.1 hypothetical protein PQ472_12140 [Lacticaseibacillus sp. KACC 23028]
MVAAWLISYGCAMMLQRVSEGVGRDNQPVVRVVRRSVGQWFDPLMAMSFPSLLGLYGRETTYSYAHDTGIFAEYLLLAVLVVASGAQFRIIIRAARRRGQVSVSQDKKPDYGKINKWSDR